MMRGIAFLCMLFSAFSCLSQSSVKAGDKPHTQTIQIRHANNLVHDKTIANGAERLIGNVIIEDDSVLMYCDSAYLFTDNSFYAFSKVHLNRKDTMDLFGDSLHYSGDTKQAEMFGKITYKQKKMTLTTTHLIYDVKESYVHYWDGGTLVDSTNTLTSTLGAYNMKEKMASFKDKVVLVNPDYTVKCDTMNYSPSFCLTEGNYVKVSPRLKVNNYLTNAFTVEFNYYANNGYGVILFLKDPDGQSSHDIHFESNGSISSGYFKKDFNASFPDQSENFRNKWHHAAFIYKNGQIKCYMDQYRVLVMPNVSESFASVQFGGIGDQANPIVFKDVRVASGGNMNMIGKKFTDAKIITHGINFDVDKATIKPESMGTLNMIVKVLNNNPDLKFEIDGHTDNSGTAKHNLDLSQQRADAVKTQLVSMGIDASRLTTKGLGDTKPISDNSTLEGKANNRRVEFIKM